MSNLNGWMDTIRRMGEESRKRDNEMLAAMQAEYPAKVEQLKAMQSPELLDHFQAYSQRGCADPRQTKIFQDLAEEAKRELLRRLK